MFRTIIIFSAAFIGIIGMFNPCKGIGFPSRVSNVEYLVTFGNGAPTSQGDDDYSQTFFFMVPESYRGDVYFRVFDPETSGRHDLKIDDYDTATRYSVYAGKGTHTRTGSRLQNPNVDTYSGMPLISQTFGGGYFDNDWFSFSPIKSTEGEWLNGFYIFKIVVEGITGNDGNFYKLFMSSSSTVNITIPGSNAFTYELTFSVASVDNRPVYLFPYIPNQDVNVLNEYNFDLDKVGSLRGYFSNNVSEKMPVSADDKWSTSTHVMQAGDIYSFLKIELSSSGSETDKVSTFYFSDHENMPLPIYAEPMGGKSG